MLKIRFDTALEKPMLTSYNNSALPEVGTLYTHATDLSLAYSSSYIFKFISYDISFFNFSSILMIRIRCTFISFHIKKICS